MTQYLDMTQTEGCFGVIPDNGETIVLTGVSVNSMPLSVKRKEGEAYDDFARKYGIYFIFDDCIPEIDFYTIPKIEIAAMDADGGFIASVGEPFSLRDPVPLVYISAERKVYLITEDSSKFLSIASEWRERLTPFDGITLYASKEDARKVCPIIDLEQTEAYKRHMQMFGE
ncbi:MAG: hypothetical protein IJ307_00825 [Bacteroidales bacterium]|nr:hypothetical protein [Bacteroidales bacterium]